MLLLLSLLSRPALPCAAIFTEDGGTASTDAQEALLEQKDGAVEVTYRVQVVHDTGRIGWIVPLYGEFQSIEDADPALFDDLRELTAPQVWIESPAEDEGGGGLGCGATKGTDLSAGGVNSAEDGQGLGVEVVAEGFTGTYSYVVLSGDSEEEVLAWLDQAGFGIGPTGPAIGSYVTEGGIQLLALTVVTDHEEQARRELPAVRIRYAGDRLRYPSLMALYGMPTEVSTRVYVQGDQRATLHGTWEGFTLGSQELDDADDVNAGYADLLRELVGDQPRYAEIWSGEYQGAWLTRFDTIAVREAHTADASFELDGGQRTSDSELWIWQDSQAAAPWLLPGLLGLGAGLGRRRRRVSGR